MVTCWVAARRRSRSASDNVVRVVAGLLCSIRRNRKRLQLVVVRQFVGGPDQRDKRHVGDAAAVVEAPFVQNGEDGVEDCGVRLEDLVEKGDVRLRQFVGRHTPVLVAFEGLQRHGPKQLLGRRELGEQPLEVLRPVDAPAQFVGEHRLGGPGRADQQQVLPGEQCGECPVDDLGAVKEELL